MQIQKPNFPFSAVTGQTLFKLALTLVAANPAIGGVLVSGPRGSAKSTLAKGLADVMPDVDFESKTNAIKADQAVYKTSPAFVTLPLSVTEEMVVGTLNLQQVLNDKQVKFQEGLFAKANNGILYVDEVNLLPDHIVDVLLDVSASGVNIVERDGISHSHAAKFILLGTMNPDEGELRPQLQDRFGLAVQLGHDYDIAERIEIVQRREAFDKNSQAFLKEYEQQQDALRSDILQTRTLLPNVKCTIELQKLIAKKCHDAQVDGLRADITWYRAALTHAALHNRLAVSEEDINAVEELVLSHRRHSSPPQSKVPPKSSDSSDVNDDFSQPQPQPKPKQKAFSRPKSGNGEMTNSDIDKSNGNESQSQDESEGKGEGDWGQMSPKQHRMFDLMDFDLPNIGHKQQTSTQKDTRIGQSIHSSKANRLSKKTTKSVFCSSSQTNDKISHDSIAESKKINWVSSLIANAGQWPLKQLRFQQAKKTQATLHLILIDTSASILKNDLFSQAKAIILKISEQAYLSREQLAIIGFGNQTVETLLPRQRAPKVLKSLLNSIPAAGGTPFREALEHAEKFQQQQYRQTPNIRIKTYIITDGKIRQSFSHINLGSETVLIDVEKSAVKRGKGQRIASDLNAFYMPLFH